MIRPLVEEFRLEESLASLLNTRSTDLSYEQQVGCVITCSYYDTTVCRHDASDILAVVEGNGHYRLVENSVFPSAMHGHQILTLAKGVPA